MTTRDDIPPCTCDPNGGSGWAQRTPENPSGLACLRHPNALSGFQPAPESPKAKHMRHWGEVHREETTRRKHIRSDEEPEQKAWRRR